MPEHPIKVFFDASSLIKVGLPPGNETFQRLVDLVHYGFISVVTTEITTSEIARHHTDSIFDRLRPLADSRFRQLASKHFHIGIPDIHATDVRSQIRKDIYDGVDRMFLSLEATVLDINQVSPSVIFSEYDQNEGLFVAQNKKNQFPDAFIFECLKSTASVDEPVFIVADDTDFEEPSNKTDHIRLVNSISGLFDFLGLMQNEPDPDLEPFLYGELMGDFDFLVYVEFDNEPMDGEKVTTVCRTIDFENINAFQQIDENAPLLVSADVTVMLDVEIEHDDGLTEYESGSGKVSFYVSVVSDEKGDPKSISDLRIFDCTLSWGGTSIWYNL